VKINARVDKNHSTSVTGGTVVFRTSETNTVDPSRMQFEQITLTANTIMGLSYATEELLADSPISFAQIVGNSFGQEMASKITDERINGTGVGQFEGVLNTPALITVAKESGQAADTIRFENITKMYARLWGKDRGVWIANHNCLPALMSIVQQVGTAGIPAWQPSAREGAPGTLLGRPVYFTEYASALGDLGDIILCDWSQYLQGTLQGAQAAESMHVRFINNERAFRFTMRNDGRSWWRSALTPKKGDTLSPFVTLAARA
jgi:HK97 family phage major capsid protein